jgi:hypothetical protein
LNGIPYVAAAYGVVVALFAVWVAIMLRHAARRSREMRQLDER